MYAIHTGKTVRWYLLAGGKYLKMDEEIDTYYDTVSVEYELPAMMAGLGYEKLYWNKLGLALELGYQMGETTTTIESGGMEFEDTYDVIPIYFGLQLSYYF